MWFGKRFGRRGLLAAIVALGAFVQIAYAETSAVFDTASGAITVTGLENHQRDLLRSEPARVTLKVADLQASRGMAVTVTSGETALLVTPRFALRGGTAYALELDMGETVLSLDVAQPAEQAPVPQLTAFSPSQAVIPENTLRLYLTFSEPMARGGSRDAITLLRSDGTEVPSPFLTQAPELWDPAQTRLTLLFDPGRVKQGVGPNTTHGAPLVSGESYRLVVAAGMKSAQGEPMAGDVHIAFRVGPAERRPIDPSAWQVLPPQPGTHAPFTIAFDRILDSGAVRRMIAVRGPDGRVVGGTVETDGGGWSLVPDRPWMPGDHTITIDAGLEDVSGNTVGVAFDAPAGTIGSAQSVQTRIVRVGG